MPVHVDAMTSVVFIYMVQFFIWYSDHVMRADGNLRPSLPDHCSGSIARWHASTRASVSCLQGGERL
jgi:hypothetical protein